MRFIKMISILLIAITGVVIWGGYILLSSLQPNPTDENPPHQFVAERLLDTPIITTEMSERLVAESERFGYTNINGPSLIRVPDWLSNPLGKYYLYFAHHKGSYIRLAYADTLTGPWTILDQEILSVDESGLATEVKKTNSLETLRKYNTWSENIAIYDVGVKYQKAYEERTKQKLNATPPTTPHVASPDVIVDHEKKQIRLYYHGVVEGVLQKSKVALSTDGLHFKAQEEIIALAYLRMFEHGKEHFGLSMPGFFYRSYDGISKFKVRKRWLFPTHHRHHALYKRRDLLYIFYSDVGDAPESIKYTFVDISSNDWNKWKTGKSVELLKPKLEWEGAMEPIEPSLRGEVGKSVNQLRDPAFFEDTDGQTYLLYTGAGEQAIGIAKLKISE